MYLNNSKIVKTLQNMACHKSQYVLCIWSPEMSLGNFTIEHTQECTAFGYMSENLFYVRLRE